LEWMQALASDGLAEAYERLKLSHALAVGINKASSVHEALAVTLRLFCEAGGWVFGQVWLPDESGQALACGPLWYASEPGLESFREASEKVDFRPGEPLLGLVWQDGQTRWTDEVHVDPRTYRRAEPAAAASLSGALVVPVSRNDRVMAVMEFLTRGRVHDSTGVRQLIDAAAAQLSSLMAQKAAEEDQRRSERRFRAVAETANDAIVSIDAEGVITYLNAGAAALFKYSADELLGSPVVRLIPERFRSAHRDGLAMYLASGEGPLLGQTVHVQALRRDGTEVPIELSLATWTEGDSPYFTAMIRDVSERHRMQAELEQALQEMRTATDRLKELDGLKNTFLDAVSHDLRGPLAALRATTTVLQRDVDDDFLTVEQRRSYLKRMTATLVKMRRLIDDLLNIERLEVGNVPLRLECTDLSDLVRRIVEEHRSDLGSRPVELDLQPVAAEVDAAKVERIVENLLLNTCRHTPDGTEVKVSVSHRDHEATISVEDAGPGVPEAMRIVIFERFWQLPGSPRGGLGIGLSLVSRLAAIHGGRAWVEEAVTGGAVFRVALPLRHAAAGVSAESG
jgi:PAS domain S-box-containing protein